MCYRASLNFALHELDGVIDLESIGPDIIADLLLSLPPLPAPMINAFAHPSAPFITLEEPLTVASWGLIPAWAKPEGIKDLRTMTANARSETAHEKPSFRKAHRGLLPVSGFFEWRHEGAKKIPYLVSSPEKIMTLGCLWEDWTNRTTGETMRTFSVLTTEANALMSYVHNSKLRMPVIIDDSDRARWLDTTATRDEVTNLMRPFRDGVLSADPVFFDGSAGPVFLDKED